MNKHKTNFHHIEIFLFKQLKYLKPSSQVQVKDPGLFVQVALGPHMVALSHSLMSSSHVFPKIIAAIAVQTNDKL